MVDRDRCGDDVVGTGSCVVVDVDTGSCAADVEDTDSCDTFRDVGG